MIVYFSGTGNSRYCAEMLADRLDDAFTDSFFCIRDGMPAHLSSERPWVFVAPTYAWQLPRAFAQFIAEGEFAGSAEAYFVMTCGSDIGDAGTMIACLCAAKGLAYRGVLQVVMPENYIAMFDVPDADESARIVSAAHPVLEEGAVHIMRGESFPDRRPGVTDKIKTHMVNPVFYALLVKSRSFYTTDDCFGCGVCVYACPMQNIRIENNRPVWGGKCTHCMACICTCPTEAIEYGRRSKGKPRYRCVPYVRTRRC